MKRLLSIIGVLLLTVVIIAQDINGQWNGVFDMQGTKLRIVFNIEQTDTTYKATMDSPDQGAKGIPVTEISFSDSNLIIEINNIGFKYSGILKNDTLIEGSFSQMGNIFPLNLKKGAIVERKRPQEPVKPYPYISEDVTFENKEAGIKLSGTFTYPKSGKKYPAVVLISGSGAQNRDEELLGHKPFLILSDYLTQKDIAVLRFDDRGVGSSEGDHSVATTKDFSTDALAAVDYLKTRKEADTDKIGLIGHSEGAMIAFMAASKSQDIAYIVSMAGSGVRGDSVYIMQSRSLPRSAKANDIVIDQNTEVTRKIMKTVREFPTEYIRQHLDSLIIAVLPKEDSSFQSEAVKENIGVSFRMMTSPWSRFFMNYDPCEDLAKVKCPVFALNGDKDIQVEADVHLNAMQQAMKNNKHGSLTIKRYPNLNHLFQNCETGGMDEYARIEETISPEVLEDIAVWILNISK